MKFASIDTETTGLDPTWCQVLQIGVVVGDLSDSPINDLPRFSCYVQHNRFVGDPVALAMNKHTFEAIAKGGPSVMRPREAVDAFRKFLYDQFGQEPGAVVCAGKCFEKLDRPMLLALERSIMFDRSILPDLLHQRSIDPTNLFWQPELDDVRLPNTKTCMERAGLKGEVQHDAIADAIDVIKLIRVGQHNLRPSLYMEDC